MAKSRPGSAPTKRQARHEKERAGAILHGTREPRPSSLKPKPSPTALLAEATSLLHTSQPSEALPLALRALALSQPDTPKALPALTLLAEIALELGDADQARSYFVQAVLLDPDGSLLDSEGGGAEKFLWLAQLSEDGGQDSVQWFEKGAAVLRKEVSALPENGPGTVDKRKKLAGALCGIIELFMTDLSWEPAAEETCETLVTEALLTAPLSPEPLQTLASIRISQQRIPEAKSALERSMQLWCDLPPEDVSVPDFPTRISLARLLMEVSMADEALEVLERLVQEDDGSVEAWYLGGWCLYLSGVSRREQSSSMDEGDDGDGEWKALLAASREWLGNALRLYEMVEYEDERLREHAVELVGEIGKEVAVGEGEGDGEEEWESEEGDGEDGAVEGAEGDNDQEMNDA